MQSAALPLGYGASSETHHSGQTRPLARSLYRARPEPGLSSLLVTGRTGTQTDLGTLACLTIRRMARSVWSAFWRAGGVSPLSEKEQFLNINNLDRGLTPPARLGEDLLPGGPRR